MSDIATLKDEQEILQRAHDYVELVGFDIGVYSERNESANEFDVEVEPSRAAPLSKLAEGFGRCCWIGTTRLVAGADPDPGALNPTAEGDGIGLGPALSRLDAVALQIPWFDPDTTVRPPSSRAPGRVAESLGFAVREKAYDKGLALEQSEADFALRVLRKALREVHDEIEEAERAA